ncbi:MAG: nucleoside triphosphate pyrophosphatase [Spirochaetota bacterium]
MRVVLASQSRQRTALLDQIGIEHIVYPVDVDEERYFAEPKRYRTTIRALALAKAKAASAHCKDALVIGADTVVYSQGRIYGKPSDADDARMTLRSLSGRKHIVATGVGVIDTESGVERTAVAESEVYFNRLTCADIEWYLMSGEPMERAGAYAIQGRGAVLIRKIAGSYSNIVGLPLELVVSMLRSLGYALEGDRR